jgi:Arc/MetJ-type ribon-helix-helix transcriptional regulator
MPTLTVSLPDWLQPFIDAQVAAGGYTSPEAYVTALVLEAQLRQERAEIDGKLLVGIEELERGEGGEMKPEDWERLRDEVRQQSQQGS